MSIVKFTKEFKGYYLDLLDGDIKPVTLTKGEKYNSDEIRITDGDHVDLVCSDENMILKNVPIEILDRDVMKEVEVMKDYVIDRVLKHVRDYRPAIDITTSTKDILCAALRDAADEYEQNKEVVKNLRCF